MSEQQRFTLSHTLRAFCATHNLKQHTLASYLSISPSALSLIINGTRLPSEEVVARFTELQASFAGSSTPYTSPLAEYVPSAHTKLTPGQRDLNRLIRKCLRHNKKGGDNT